MIIEEEVIKAESDLLQAMLQSNVKELDRLISDRLIFAAHTGEIFSKKDDLDAHRSGMIIIENITANDQLVNVYENFAIVFVLLRIKGSFFGQQSEGTFRFSRVWMKEGDRLKVVSGHSTLINDQVV